MNYILGESIIYKLLIKRFINFENCSFLDYHRLQPHTQRNDHSILDCFH